MKKFIVVIIFFTIISKIFGFVRDVVLSYYYGIGQISDAYIISTTIPLSLFAMIGAGIVTGYIPIYSKIHNACSEKNSNDFTNNILNITILFSLVIIFVSYIYARQIVAIFASGFNFNTLNLTISFTRISLISIIFSSVVCIFTAYLQVNNKYYITALAGLPFNFFIVLSIVLSAKISLYFLPIGINMAFIAQVLFILPSMYKSNYKYKYIVKINDSNVIDMIKISTPAIVGVSLLQINLLVDRTIASSIIIGGVSALNYSHRVIDFVIGIFIAPIIVVVYPYLSRSIVCNSMIEFKKNLNEAIVAMSLLVIPCMFGLMIFSSQIISLLFARGMFNADSVLLTSGALFFYSLGILFLGLREIFSRCFYAMNETKIPVRNAVTCLLINIFLNITLSKFMGINGLALATSISAIIATLMMLVSLRKKIGSFGIKQISISFFKIVSASCCMGIISKSSYYYLLLKYGQNISLLITIVVAAISYIIIIYFMRIEDIDLIVIAVKKKFKK